MTEKTIYERNYDKLMKLFKIEDLDYEETLKFTSDGFMDLNVDVILAGNGEVYISMSHTYEQNGDLMMDPEMEIAIRPSMKMVEAITYRNDSVGVYQNVYQYDENGTPTHVSPKLKKELNAFLGTWLNNIKHQGYKSEDQRASEEGQKILNSFIMRKIA